MLALWGCIAATALFVAFPLGEGVFIFGLLLHVLYSYYVTKRFLPKCEDETYHKFISQFLRNSVILILIISN